jgi:hypothetical protein
MNGPIKIVNELTFDRSDPDAVVAITADGDKRTRLEDLRENNSIFVRSDIGMVNAYEAHCESCTCGSNYDDSVKHLQFLVYATADGSVVGEGLEYMSEARVKQCMEIAKRIVATAKVHSEFKVYLRG